MEDREGAVEDRDQGADEVSERPTPLVPLSVVTEPIDCVEDPKSLDVDLRSLLAPKPDVADAPPQVEPPSVIDESARVTPVIEMPFEVFEASWAAAKGATARACDEIECETAPALPAEPTSERIPGTRRTASLPPVPRSRLRSAFVVLVSAAVGAMATFAILTWARPLGSRWHAPPAPTILSPLTVPNVAVQVERPPEPSTPCPVAPPPPTQSTPIVEMHHGSHHHHAHGETRAGVEPFRPGFVP